MSKFATGACRLLKRYKRFKCYFLSKNSHFLTLKAWNVR
ncbi:hypothetical protein J891_0491 [Acinetobacter baumannii 44327_8]|uniref:Uncharacterized protein n=1 Tax=Acinetobacter baumannii 1462234 TaxID=1310646 RepID=A0A9P3CXF0_ACIBA|nr:hypothetical protein ACINIS143_3953 [Acinetobacter baumannii IS-143]EXA60005.1 hypothetical protein J521_3322 [Acinetobacter baumannii 1035119]EXB15915.1 hypothetical protein J513_0325 [Acinetobacter baumannii 1397084]EXB63143.1 hypothetical protein J545_1956 [Acinetobacter baumannii 1462234]EXC75183.1 hypothetical protein J473_1432 [Acinetobacter baumannii 1042969-1265]EXC94307.1 hypothetical protein J484_2221 [Acinetobacter baumannii 1051830]EXD11168.1 hypothetical protein J499_1394 [Aci